MTRIAFHSQAINLRSAGGHALSLGAVALAFGFAAASANAACTAGPMTVGAGAGQTYTCTRNCQTTGVGLREIGRVTLSGHSATLSQCLAECSRTRGCATVNYSIVVEMRDGVAVQTIDCRLYGAGEVSAYDFTHYSPGRQHGVCYRDPPGGLWRDPRIQIDTRIVDQDSARAGVPGPNVPFQKK
jgi:hypothetical protein